jgi:prolyl oligopeptidase
VLAENRLVVQYLSDAHTVVRTFDLAGKSLGEVALPGLGTASGFGGRRWETETFYVYTDFTTPSAVYRHDLVKQESTLWKRPEVAFDATAFESTQVFYTSKDGTRVPMYLTHKKGLALDGKNPTILYGYGGFNLALTPAFDVSVLGAGLARAGRRLRHPQPARRRRVRRGVAQGRHQAAQAERLR